MQKILSVVTLLVSAQAALAQSPASSGKGTASSPQRALAAAAPVEAGYRSAFTDYRPYSDPQPASWRESNESARALGGHRGQIGPEAPAAASASVPAPAGGAAVPAPHRH